MDGWKREGAVEGRIRIEYETSILIKENKKL
jgi:hypothetical protein